MNYEKKIESLEKRLERMNKKLDKTMCLCRKQANEIEEIKRFNEAVDWAVMRHERKLYHETVGGGQSGWNVGDAVGQSVGQAEERDERGSDGGKKDEQKVTQVMNEYLLFPDEIVKTEEDKP